MIDLAAVWLGLKPWFPAITVSAFTSVVWAAIVSVSKTSFEKRLQSGFDNKLELLRSHFRKDEETWKSRLKASDDQIAALRQDALQGMSQKRAASAVRRIEATEAIWRRVVELRQVKGSLSLTSYIDLEVLIKNADLRVRDSEKVRSFAKSIFPNVAIDNLKSDIKDLEFYRLYADPLLWSLFQSYFQLIFYLSTRVIFAQKGMGLEFMNGPADILNVLKGVLPAYAEVIDQRGELAIGLLLDQVEELLLHRSQSTLLQEIGNVADVEAATRLLNAVNDANANIRLRS